MLLASLQPPGSTSSERLASRASSARSMRLCSSSSTLCRDLSLSLSLSPSLFRSLSRCARWAAASRAAGEVDPRSWLAALVAIFRSGDGGDTAVFRGRAAPGRAAWRCRSSALGVCRSVAAEEPPTLDILGRGARRGLRGRDEVLCANVETRLKIAPRFAFVACDQSHQSRLPPPSAAMTAKGRRQRQLRKRSSAALQLRPPQQCEPPSGGRRSARLLNIHGALRRRPRRTRRLGPAGDDADR